MIAVLQCIKDISISAGKPVMLGPLVLVILCSMVKDAFEDWKRHQNDRSENEVKVTDVYDPKTKSFEKK